MKLDRRSIDLRQNVLLALEHAGKGHVGSAMSLIEILRVLYDDVLEFRAAEPKWKNRDRLILSPGHGALALYSVLVDKGFFSKDKLSTFLDVDSMLGGCVTSKIPGVEATTGSLGHGFSVGVGLALASRIRGRDSHIFVIVGDGELGEGSNWEAAMCASKHKLENLTVIVDNNKVQCSGMTSQLTGLDPLKKKFESFGFVTYEVDGHNVLELKEALTQSKFNGKTSAVICNTVMGKGIKFAENTAKWHWRGKIDSKMISDIKKSFEDYIC